MPVLFLGKSGETLIKSAFPYAFECFRICKKVRKRFL